MIEIKGGRKEQIVREWFNSRHGGRVPKLKVLELYEEFELTSATTDLSYGLFNGVVKKLLQEGAIAQDEEPVHSVVEPQVLLVGEMEFPDFALHRTGKAIDLLFSDHEDGGGIYGGTVNIVVGESGVGKSTVLFDLLASCKQQAPETRILYVSSEMTRNDILFYYRKSPNIGQVPTLLLNDHLKDGNLDKVLEDAFNGEWDIIVLDSYQDAAIKLTEALGWRQKRSETWLTNSMIEAAETRGLAVLAIQHMTKSGHYMGSTYLKHATTSMLEIRFDPNGGRYLEFSKNRRGGGQVNKRLYYELDPEIGVVYDELRFEDQYGPAEEESTVDFCELDERTEIRPTERHRFHEWIFGPEDKDNG
jgi:archaellum biogenesis ATPase FlaH